MDALARRGFGAGAFGFPFLPMSWFSVLVEVVICYF
jgi:hypothetical protein